MAARCLAMIVIMAILSILGGCAHYYYQGESPLEKNWGRSFESAKYNQMLNPEVGENLEPVDGFDGAAAEMAQQRYLKCGEQKKKPESTEFGVMTVKQQAY